MNNANILTKQTAAPSRLERLTLKRIADSHDTRKPRYDTARQVINSLKKEGREMLRWLFEKGISIDTAAKYDDVQLQQLILYWHLLEQADQAQLLAAQPVLYMIVNQHNENDTRDTSKLNAQPGENPKGTSGLTLLQEGQVSPFVKFQSKRFFQPSNVVTGGKLDRSIISDTFVKPLAKYDGAWAAVLQRWEYGDVVTSESEGPSNLYGIFVWAHEFTHYQQDMFAPLYDLEQKKADAQKRFQLLNSDTDTPVYRKTPDLRHQYPTQRSIEGANPVKRVENEYERWSFSRDKTLSPTDSEAVNKCLSICYDAGVPVGGGISIYKFLIDMGIKIKAALDPLVDNQGPHVPCTDMVWMKTLADMAKYMSPTLNNIQKLPALDKVPEVSYNASKSVIEALFGIIDADTTFTNDEHDKLKKELVIISRQGLQALAFAIQAFQVKVLRSIEMQKQTCKLFPNLIGRFTDYSNVQFNQALEKIKSTIANPLMTGDARFAQFLPAAVNSKMNELRRRIGFKTEADLAKVSVLDWYELGAPIGVFNVYTAEYDAESHALWLTAPEEFVEMYKRAGEDMTTDKTKEILNQATYVSIRGIYQTSAHVNGDGTVSYNVPEYTD